MSTLRERYTKWNENDDWPGGKLGGFFFALVPYVCLIACAIALVAYFGGQK